MKAVDTMALWGLDDAAGRLGDFIARQRWFAGGGHGGIRRTVIEDTVTLREGEVPVVVVIARVELEDGAVQRYQVPLAARADATTVWEGNVVGWGTYDARPAVIFDALADGEGAWAYWEAMVAGAEIEGERGSLLARQRGLAPDAGGPDAIRPLGREQSNSSMVRGEREMLKVIRRVVDGPSAEIEMTEALAGHGFLHVPTPLGVMEYRDREGRRSLLAIVQPYLTGGTEGWALALTSLRDLLAGAAEGDEPEGLDHRTVVLEQGSSFIPEAERIGAVTAAMHLALADTELPSSLRPEPITPATLRGWADAMRAELDALLGSAALAPGGALHDALAPLLAARDRLHREMAAIVTVEDAGLAIRGHGDYHLGQLLRTNSGWTVLDFEGEPDRDPAERRSRASGLRDVAGMMRSFDYAAAVELRDWTGPAGKLPAGPNEPDAARLQGRADAWTGACREAFWRAYLASIELTAGPRLLPASVDQARVMLHALEVQKAVYELAYEIGHRPDWASIPLRFLVDAPPP